MSLYCSGFSLTGATCSFSPSSGTPSFFSTATITTSSNTPTGTYTVVLAGSGCGNPTYTVSVTITSAGVEVRPVLNAISPTSYCWGTTIYWSGNSFTPNGAVVPCLAGLCSGTFYANSAGGVSGTFYVGSNVPTGTQNFWAVDQSSGKNTPSYSLTIKSSSDSSCQTCTSSISTSAMSINQGSSGSSSNYIYLLSGAGSISLSPSNPGNGITVSLSPTSGALPFYYTTYVTVSSTTLAGTYTIYVYGNGCGSPYNSFTLTVKSVNTCSFSLGNTGPITITNAGGSGWNIITSALLSGSSSNTITLSCSGLPSGASCVFQTQPIPQVGFNSRLDIYTTISTPAGRYTITVTGVGCGTSAYTQFTLTVGGSCTSSISAPSISVGKGETSSPSTVTVSLTGGTAQAVSLSCSNLPSGASCSFSPSSGSPTYYSLITVTAATTTLAGSYTGHVNGVGCSNPSGAFSLKVTQTAVQVSMTVYYTVSSGSGYSAPILYYYLGGNPTSKTLTTTPTPISVDQSTAWSVGPNPLSGSGSTQQWYSVSTLSGIADSNTHNFYYYNQFMLYMGVNPSGAGTVTPSSGWQNAGISVSVTASAYSGYQFTSWTGSGSGSSSATTSSTTVTMNAYITETANFATLCSYSLSASPSSVTVTKGSGFVQTIISVNLNSGSCGTATLSIQNPSAAPGLTFSFGQPTGSPSFSSALTIQAPSQAAGQYQMIVQGVIGTTTQTATVTVTVSNPTTQYTITVNTNPSGLDNPQGGGTYNSGTQITISTTSPLLGWVFGTWQRDGVAFSTQTSFSYTVEAAHTFTAIYNQVSTGTITVNTSPSGLDSPTGAGSYNQGTSITINVGSVSGYTFQKWQKDSIDYGLQASFQYTVEAGSHAFVAIFQQTIQYTITVNTSPSGLDNPQGGAKYNSGATATISVGAASGYLFQNKWLKDGVDCGTTCGTSTSFTYTVDADHTFTAVFQTQYTLTVNTNPTGLDSPQGGGSYSLGASVTISVSAVSGYTFQKWQMDGTDYIPHLTDMSFSYTVDAVHTFTAVFTQIKYTITVNTNPSGLDSPTGAGNYTQNTSITISVSSSAGCYTFLKWQKDGIDSGVVTPSFQYTVDASHTFTAIFQAPTAITMTVSYQITGGGSPTAPTFTYTSGCQGKSQPLTATPTPLTVDSGSTWSVSPTPLLGSGSTERWTNSTTLNGRASAQTLSFMFYHQYLLTLSYGVIGGGSPSPPFFTASYLGSTKQQVLSSSTIGYWFDALSTWAVTDPLTPVSSTERWFTSQVVTGTITAAQSTLFTYQHQYMLTMNPVDPVGSGTATPTTGWQSAGTSVPITATPSTGYDFSAWTGTGTGSYTGSNNPASVTMTAPLIETASFELSAGKVMMTVSYQILPANLMGTGYTPPIFNYARRGVSNAQPLTTTPYSLYVDSGSNWSVTANPLAGSSSSEQWTADQQTLQGTASNTTLVFTFQHQYSLTMAVTPSGAGTTTPSSGWQNAATQVPISTTPVSEDYSFTTWTCTGSGCYNGVSTSATISSMTNAMTETANFQVQPQIDFLVWSSPLEQTIQPGESTQFTVTALLLSGTTRTVTLSVDSGLPSGATYAYNPSSGKPTYSSILTIQTTALTPLGVYTLTLTGKTGSVIRTVNVLLKISNALSSDFTVRTLPAAAKTDPGTPVSADLYVTYLHGYSSTVLMSLITPPTGISVQFNPSTSSGASWQSSVTITVDSTTMAGTYILEFKGTGSDGKAHSTYFLLIVNYTSTAASFTLSANPPTIAAAIPVTGTNTGSTNLHTIPANGFAGDVALTILTASLPAGTTSTVTPASVTLPPAKDGSTTITVSSSAQSGIYIIQATGTNTGTTRRADFALILTPTPRVSVTITKPLTSGAVSCTVEILANITDTTHGPTAIQSATYQVTGSSYSPSAQGMTNTAPWVWRGLWDSTAATSTTGTYTITVTGTNNEGATGTNFVTVSVDNTACPKPYTYYVNYAVNPTADYAKGGWIPESNFLPGETVGIRYPATGVSGVSFVVRNSNGVDVTSTLTATSAGKTWLGSDGYLYATVPLAGIGNTAQMKGQYTVVVTYKNLQSLPTQTPAFTVNVVGLSADWNVLNGLGHASVTGTFYLGDHVEQLKGREQTIRVSTTVGPSGTPAEAYVNHDGIATVTVPYYDWESNGVVFKVTYAKSNIPIVGTNWQPLTSQPFKYMTLGILYSTTGKDYGMQVTIQTVQKSQTTTRVPSFVALQVPETGQWYGTSTPGIATINLSINPMKPTFSIQAWVYSLDNSIIFNNEYTNLRITTENTAVVITNVNAQRINSQLTITGNLVTKTSTMTLTNIEVSITAKDQQGNTVASTVFIKPLNAGTNTPFTTTLAGNVPAGTYTITVTVRYIPTGWTLGTIQNKVTVN